MSNRPWLFIAIATIVAFILIKFLAIPSWIVSIGIMVFAYFIFASPVFQSKSVSDADKRTILYEQILSILRKVLAILGSLMALGVFDKIPLIGGVQNVLIYLAENWSMTTGALETLIGTVMVIISQFSSNQRFEARAGKRLK